jgi:hypothetical protein
MKASDFATAVAIASGWIDGADVDAVYVYDGSQFDLLMDAHEYVVDVDGSKARVTFPADTDLYSKCAAIYEKWGQGGVIDFVTKNYPQDVEWGICVPCEHRSPFDKDDPDTCLVCGSSERDDNIKLED